MPRLRRLLATCLVVAAGVAFGQRAPVGSLYGPVPVASVVDGDTLVVTSNVGPRTVRLIGVDTPETRHPSVGREPFAGEASAFLRTAAPAGELVWLELGRGVEDDFGRLLAYVYVEDERGDWLIDGLRVRQLNLALAEAGWARVMSIAPNVVYADLYEDAVARARADGRGMWAVAVDGRGASLGAGAGARVVADGSPMGPVVIACVLYDPATPNDTAGEWVSVWVREAIDTRGYYVWDEGSQTGFRLPAGVQEPGELRLHNPDQGVWNNGGDTIYLMRGEDVVDAWDYTDARAAEGEVVCRGIP